MGRWVQIRKFLSWEDVLVERSVLHSAGVITWSPDEQWYSTYNFLSVTSAQGFRLFVLDRDVADARAILRNAGPEADTSYPCPKCGGRTRRLRHVLATALMSTLMLAYGGYGPFPFFRRRRICNADRTRFAPYQPESFSPQELGYRL